MATAGNYFVRYEEVKTNHNNHKAHKFFLVDNTGASHLAATAEEIADAHYNYQSEAAFEQYGVVHGHARKELIIWLEKVIKESEQAAKGQALDVEHVVHLGSPTKTDPFGTFFVSHRQERIVLPNGRRCNQWFLVDQHGKEHLAVTGTERETRDAHYTYYATEAFADEHPLECNNQSKVWKWIETMLTHHCPPGVHLDAAAGLTSPRGMSESGGKASGQMGSPAGARARLNFPACAGSSQPGAAGCVPNALTPGSDPTAAPSTSNGTGVSGRSTPALGYLDPQPTSSKPTKAGKSGKPPSSSKGAGGSSAGGKSSAGMKHKLVGVAQDAHIKKLRRLAMESEEALRMAQAQHLLQLRKAAAAEASSREMARRTTGHWVRGGLSGDEEQVLSQWLDQLKQLLTEANKEQLQTVPYNAIRLDPDLNQLLATASPVHLQPAPSQVPSAHAIDAAQPRSDEQVSAADGIAMAVDKPVADHDAAATTAPTSNGNVQIPDTGQGFATTAAQQQHSSNSAVAAGITAGTGAMQTTPQQASTWTYADPHTNKHALRMVLECLREVAALLISLKAFESGNLIDTVQAYAEQHPHPAVIQLAKHCLGVWQRAVLGKVKALLAPELLQDPLAALEARIVTGQIQYPPDVLEKQQLLQQQLLATAEAVAASAAAAAASSTPPPEGIPPGLMPGLTPAGTPHLGGAALAGLIPGLDLSAALAQASGIAASAPPTPSLTLPPGLSLAALQQAGPSTAPAGLKSEPSIGAGSNGAATLLLAPLLGAPPVCGSTAMLATGGPASEGGNTQGVNMDQLGSPLDLTAPAPAGTDAAYGLQAAAPSVQQAAAAGGTGAASPAAASSPASHFLQMLASPIQGLARGLSQSLGQGLWPLNLGNGQPAASASTATQQQQGQNGQAVP